MQYYKSRLWDLTTDTEQRKEVGDDSGFRVIARLCLEELQQTGKTRNGGFNTEHRTLCLDLCLRSMVLSSWLQEMWVWS